MFQRRPLSSTLACTFLVACAAAEPDAAAGPVQTEMSNPVQTEMSNDMTRVEGCGCSAKQAGFVHQPLACACGPESGDLCPSTLDQALAVMCPPGGEGPVIRKQGCGKIALEGPGGYVGAIQTFDAESGALVGVYEYSDISSGPCDAFGYISGDALFVGSGLRVGASCPEADYCMACGTGAYSACTL